MGIGLFSEVGLVPVAYIRVEGTLGVAPNANSGLTVTKLSTGVYRIDIPPELAVPVKECFPIVQIWQSQCYPSVEQVGGSVNQLTQLLVQTYDGSNSGARADSTFTLVLFRTVSPPVDGAPA